MRRLIENIVNEELSMLVEKRRVRRRRLRRRNRRNAGTTQQNARTKAYNRAFSNTGVDDKAAQEFLHFLRVTEKGLGTHPYSWALTRCVWAARRVYDFAKTSKTTPTNFEEIKSAAKSLGFNFATEFDRLMRDEQTTKTDLLSEQIGGHHSGDRCEDK